jgi:aldehyde dehydrogenase (NAD+)
MTTASALPDALSDAARSFAAGPHRLLIGGERLDAADGRTFETLDPATGRVIAEVPQAGAEDVDRAVRAAREAFEDGRWTGITAAQRTRAILALADAVEAHADELAELESLDNGKPLKLAKRVDVPLTAEHLRYFAGWPTRIEGETLPVAIPDMHCYTRKEPVGVCGQIIPWNFPLLMAAWKIAPALACGNTIVLKPAETTPLTALLLAEICEEADLPPGVVNVVTGDGRTGAALVAHPDVDKIAFTGSTEVGKIIQKTIAGTRKRVTLELGGKAANVVFADAPLDQAIEGVVSGIYFNQGHVCCAGSRLLVQESVHDEIVEKLKARIETLKLGNPLDKNTDIGAINSAAQHAKICELVQSGIAEGAVFHQQSCDVPERGYWHRASFFTGVAQSHRIAREEIFGPVLSIMTFRTADEAVEKANNTPYGLSAGVWTDKGAKSMYVAQRLQAGVVWCSTFNQFDPSSPFGGYRESGFGREGGVAGLKPYLTY